MLPSIKVNSRQNYKGFTLHPRNDQSFQFTETQSTKLTYQGLLYLKISLSYSLGNNFEDLQNHVE